MSRALIRALLRGDYSEELTKVVKTLWERAKAYLLLRGNGVSSIRCPAALQLKIKAATYTVDLYFSTGSVCLPAYPRLPQYW